MNDLIPLAPVEQILSRLPDRIQFEQVWTNLTSGEFQTRYNSDLLALIRSQCNLETSKRDSGLIRRLVKCNARLIWPGHALCPAWILLPHQPANRSVAPVSSRLGKSLNKKSHVFQFLRTLACNLDPMSEFLLFAEKTSLNRYAKYLSDALAIPSIEILYAKKSQTINKLILSFEQQQASIQRLAIAFVEKDVPLDSIVFTLADEIRALDFRERGNIEKLLFHRLQRQRSNQRTFVAIPPLKPPQLPQTKLMNEGAIGWHLLGSQPELNPNAKSTTSHKSIALSEIDSENFLHHFTRPPGNHQPTAQIYDLLFSDFCLTEGALITLTQIAAKKMLLSTNRLTPTQKKMCCFTEVPLREFSSLRVFRSHLSRWDFLPFGVSIRKSVLLKHGVRQVIYAPSSTFESMSEDDKPFYQQARTTTKTRNTIDWTKEREWRIIGNVNLATIADQDIFVFVPDSESANHIASFTNWRICIVEPK